MTRFAIAYVATGVAFLVMDAIWLSQMVDRLYRPAVGQMMIEGFRPIPAVVFYLIFVAGLIFFAAAPALRVGDWRIAALNGAMYGFFCYATYDLTNQATLKQWSTLVSVADMAWGAFVSCVAATAGYSAAVAFIDFQQK